MCRWSIKKNIFSSLEDLTLKVQDVKNPADRCKSKSQIGFERIVDANWSIRKSLPGSYLPAGAGWFDKKKKKTANKQTLLVNQSEERWYAFSPPGGVQLGVVFITAQPRQPPFASAQTLHTTKIWSVFLNMSTVPDNCLFNRSEQTQYAIYRTLVQLQRRLQHFSVA